MKHPRQVQLIVRLEHGCHRHLLSGVAAFSRGAGWDLHVSPYEQATGGFFLDPATDGLLTPHGTRSAVQRSLRPREKPVVYYGQGMAVTGRGPAPAQWFPDEMLIGPCAADHLMARGFTRFVYAHHARWQISRERGLAFRAHLAAAGFPCHWLDVGSLMNDAGPRALDRLARRLRKWPRPAGVLAFNDIVAAFVVRALKRAELHCPGDIAMVGVDNDELLCETLAPPLSSIDTDWFRMGYEAAEGLDLLLRGGRLERQKHPVPPRGVALRASSDFLAFPDEKVVKALCFIRAQVGRGIDTSDVLSEVLVSRPTLDLRFKKYLGHTVADEIQNTRADRARQLLCESELTLEQIATACGLQCADTLYRLFRHRFGVTPGQYRKSAARPAPQRGRP